MENTKGKREPIFNNIKEVVFMLLGVVTAAFALKGFLVPNSFFDGGVNGISLLIHEIYHINLAYVVLLVNLPFLIIGAYVVNRQFAIKTFISIVLMGLCLNYVQYPIITHDKLLIAVFGGFFSGCWYWLNHACRLRA